MNFNRVIIGGNLTRDPELNHTNGGNPVANFGIAQNEVWTDRNSGERREKANYFECNAWGPRGETIAEHFSKGKPILIEGKLDYQEWEAQDGSKRSAVKIKVDRFEFVGSKDDNGGSSNGSRSSGGRRRQRQEVEVTEDDFADIPF